MNANNTDHEVTDEEMAVIFEVSDEVLEAASGACRRKSSPLLNTLGAYTYSYLCCSVA